MYNGSLKNFFLAKTTHRIPKIVTLLVASGALMAMVSIDASASAFGGRDSNSVRSAVVLTLASDTNNSQFTGLVKRWSTISSISPTTAPATPTPVATAGSGGGAAGGSVSGGGTAPSTTTTTGPSTTTTTAPPTTTTTAPPTTTTTTPSSSAASVGPITAGASRSECLTADSSVANNLSALQSTINTWQAQTNSTVTCLGAYGSDQTWSDWTDPWFTGPAGSAYTSWIAQDPQVRQMVLGISLIPSSIQTANPLGWEQSCAAGNFDSYATQLGTNLVAAGLQNSVIRLAWEMNGPWEGDFVGTTTQEQGLWATCFANEVTSLRQAAGEHFLIDWNPNACTETIPYANYYPGNAYVDIMGLDFYDVSCDSPNTAVSFAQLAGVPSGLTSFEAFAAAQGKPMSFPEWGLVATPSGDDPAYIAGVGAAVDNGDFAFQQYFDVTNGGTMLLNSSTPLSIAAYKQYFGN